MKAWRRMLAILETIAFLVVSMTMPGIAFSEESAGAVFNEAEEIVSGYEEAEVVESVDLVLDEYGLTESTPPETPSGSDEGTQANSSKGPSSIHFTETEIEMRPGEEENLMDYLEITPDDAETTYSWKSSKKKVAKVDKDGIVTAVGSGTAKITVKTKNKKKATIKITVPKNKIDGLCDVPTRDDYEEVEGGWTLWPLSIEVTSKGRIECEFYMLNGTGEKSKRINNMKLSLAVGTPDNIVAESTFSKISVSCKNNKYKKIKVTFPAHTVKQKDVFFPDYADEIYFDIADINGFNLKTGKNYYDFIPTMFPGDILVSEIDIPDVHWMTVGEQYTITTIIKPENATDQRIIWSSDNPSIATVENGVVTALSLGETLIRAEAADGGGAADSVNLYVVKEVYSVELSDEELTMAEGENRILSLRFYPETTIINSTTWTSSDPTIASVDQSGKITAIRQGHTTITVTVISEKGQVEYAECDVTVIPVPEPVKVTSITLDQTSATLTVGDTLTLKPTVLPDNATDKNIKWSSSNETVATVTDGVVKTIAAGHATIIAEAKDGSGVKAECAVFIEPVKVTSITLDPPSATLTVGQTLTLIHTVLPDNATNKDVEWKSDNISIATVDNHGVVTAISEGEAIITATAVDGSGKNSYCVIDVILDDYIKPTPLDDFYISEGTIIKYKGQGGDVVIPSVDEEGKPVVKIGSRAFDECSNLTNVIIPDSITCIDYGAFMRCTDLVSVNIPDSVTTIGGSAFYHCSSLTCINIPDSVTSIETDAFCFCTSLKRINLSANMTSIEPGTFRRCTSLEDIAIPVGITKTENYAFEECSSLVSVDLPTGITSIGTYTFKDCSNLTTVSIPDSLIYINYGAFYRCNQLVNIYIPSSVIHIGAYAFRGCSSLASIYLPNSVTNIGSYAFKDCSNLSLYGEIGSYAETYAQNNSLKYSFIIERENNYLIPALVVKSAEMMVDVYDRAAIEIKLQKEGFHIGYMRFKNYNNPEGDHVGYAFAEKTYINPCGEKSRLYAIIVRGTVGAYEWASNFDFGNGFFARGFQNAANELWEDFKDYHTTIESIDPVDVSNQKLWTTGHSRGGAVSNLIAAVHFAQIFEQKNVYCYTFASARPSKNVSERNYIFNFLNPGDTVTYVPMPQFGYERYGTDLDITKHGTYSTSDMNTQQVTEAFIEALVSLIKRNEQTAETIGEKIGVRIRWIDKTYFQDYDSSIKRAFVALLSATVGVLGAEVLLETIPVAVPIIITDPNVLEGFSISDIVDYINKGGTTHDQKEYLRMAREYFG